MSESDVMQAVDTSKRRRDTLPFDIGDIQQTIHGRFEQVVAIHAGRTAVCVDGHITTYLQLNEAANRVAREINRISRAQCEGVAILLQSGEAQIASILGVLKSGRFYVSLDPSLPLESIQYMLRHSGAQTMITNRRFSDLGARIGNADLILFDELDDVPASNVTAAAHPGATAYIYYTSGTTGTPKGVYDCHRNVLHNIYRYTNTLDITHRDRLSLLQPPGFSGAVSSLFGALLNGAASYPFDCRRRSPVKFRSWLSDSRITIYHSVPAIFRLLGSDSETYPDVRLIRLEGDQSSRNDVALFKRHFAESCVLVNGLGTTESGLVSQFFVKHTDEPPESNVPVGYDVPDMETLVLDPQRRPVPPGTVGEIAVRSRYLAVGYWQDPDGTRQSFLADPGDNAVRTYLTGDLGRFDEKGALVHLGRKEQQARLRGSTILLADVESALTGMDSIAAAVVAVIDRGTERERLVAYFVRSGGAAPTTSAIYRALAETLPANAIPSRFIELEYLPRNANGKIDRSALPIPHSGRPALDVPRIVPKSLLQLQLCQIWERTLGITGVGIRDNFFELGGHSLLAMNMLLEVEESLGLEIDGSSLLAAPTIEQLAELIVSRTQHLKQPIVAIQEGDGSAPFFYLHGDYLSCGYYCLNLARHLEDSLTFYAVSSLDTGGDAREFSYEAMAARHIADLRRIQPNGPYCLGGTCNGAMIAYEMARQLVARGESVGLLALNYGSAANLRFRHLSAAVTAVGNILGLSEQRRSASFFRLREIYLNLTSHGGRERLKYLVRKAKVIPRTLGGILSPPEKLLVDRNETEVYKHYRYLDAVYMPGKYPGTVSLIWPSGEPESADEAARWWRKVARHVEVHPLASDHYSSLTNDVALLAAVLSDCLQRTRQP